MCDYGVQMAADRDSSSSQQSESTSSSSASQDDDNLRDKKEDKNWMKTLT